MKVVVKVGSNVLTRDDGTVDVTRVSSLVDQIVTLRQRGDQVILVSSGAIASGRTELKGHTGLDSVAQRQLFSSVGQVRLMDLYYRFFRDYGVNVGQVLLQKRNFETPDERENVESCMDVLLENDVMPIINENDTVSITELMFTDNDELSGLVARMLGAETLILLSNIDGIYDGDIDSPESSVIEKVEPGEELSKYIKKEKSAFGRGGMYSKYITAGKVSAAGIRVMIANGKREHILTDLAQRPEKTLHTEFIPTKQ